MSTSDRKELLDAETMGYAGRRSETVVYNPDVDVSGVDEDKLVRKVDWRLLPWLSFLYLLSFLDRTSIGNARVRWLIPFLLVGFDVYRKQLYHLTDDLHLNDRQYLLCLTIFYFSYAFFEVCLHSLCACPSNSERVLTGPKQCAPQEAAS